MVFRTPSEDRSGSAAADLAAVAALDDPMRAAVLDYVSHSEGLVSRDQAAAALGVTRRVAAFHLDRLAAEGWLDVRFRRLSERIGPGAGRPNKLYGRSDLTVQVSVPPRNYKLLARLLVAALLTRWAAKPDELRPAALELGRQLGESAKGETGRRASRPQLQESLLSELAEQGFEPVLDDGVIWLRNCPFHDLARANRDLVCGANLALMQGLSDGLGISAMAPVREDPQGSCCVAFKPTQNS